MLHRKMQAQWMRQKAERFAQEAGHAPCVGELIGYIKIYFLGDNRSRA
jgi:hypothetical protein